MSDPIYYCKTCGRSVNVMDYQYGRGFPPDKAKRALKKMHNPDAPIQCAKFDPQYRVGLGFHGPIMGQQPEPPR